MPSVLRPITAFASKTLHFQSNKNAEASLIRKLNRVDRVNPPPPQAFEEELKYADYTHCAYAGIDQLHHLLDRINGDGLWTCCRGHEGPHPFKRLKCFLCEHVLCGRCCTTEVLTLLNFGRALLNEYSEISGLVSYGQICPNCGLSHRAQIVDVKVDSASTERQRTVTFSDLLCVCGRLSDNTWLHFWIGPIYEYRRRPHEAFAILSCQRAETAIRRRREGSEDCDRRMSLPVSSSTRNMSMSVLSISRALFATGSTSSSSLSSWSFPWSRAATPSASASLGSRPISRLSQPPPSSD
ncbi:hypothetical protein BKA66DRAFT_439621 [Pyrenochaeta sp. MPI-SDFR-AT-0127]|nr:hypothetical protein BKA66DRAFT_439621 [Pyrenochaeta sp. MPI-SDFR-AT-0127]